MQIAVGDDFQLDAADVHARLARARVRADTATLDAAVEQARRGEGLDADALALLWSARLSTSAIYELARTARRQRPVRLETFAPLYLTNTCDAACRMCGMRRDNGALLRETADGDTIDTQLRTLRRRGMHAVALLTGEYHRGRRRGWALEFVNHALRRTQQLGFRHVLINVGSIDDDEFAQLLDGIPRRADGTVEPKLTMCTFQETYSRAHYAKFMGVDAENPRADYDRRLTNFDRCVRVGLRAANPGVLVGLNPDLGFELIALAAHARHLLARGMEVYLSVPRLRQIAGSHDARGADDDAFVRLVSLLALAVPAGKIVLTTRESEAIQRLLVPIVTVLSAGSAAVTPYTETGARFPLETSQFEVIDQRPFEEILSDWHGPGGIENFEPVAVD